MYNSFFFCFFTFTNFFSKFKVECAVKIKIQNQDLYAGCFFNETNPQQNTLLTLLDFVT